MMRRLLQPFWVLLAVIFLIEAWLWDHLEPVVARIVALIPFRAVKQWLTSHIDKLSPAMTLIVFCVPAVLLFPVKLAGLWLLAHGFWVSAMIVILFGKFVGLGVTAFIFDVTRNKLMQMGWFRKIYEFVMMLRAKAAELVEPVKRRVRELLRGNGDGWSARMLRLIQRFRRRVHEAR